MALCRFEAKIISRSGGRSTVGAASYRSGKCATSAAAYRAGAELTDERTGQTFDYTRKRGVEAAEILLPDNAPEWMRDRGQLWNAVEKAEKRSDAQLARDYILTLPHELNAEQRRDLTRDFVKKQFVEKGYVADIAWHEPHGKGDERNHHAHVMVVMRKIEGNGFARTKERAPEGQHPAAHWKKELEQQREAWAHTGADALAKAGFEIEAARFRAGHLTLEKQREAAIARGDKAWADALDREAEPKQGPLATRIEREGRESHAGNDRRAAQARNAERASLRHEHETVTAQIIDLDAERQKRGGRDWTQAEIRVWTAHKGNASTKAFVAELADKGLILARASELDVAELKEIREAMAVHDYRHGMRYAPPEVRVGELVAVNRRGGVHRLNADRIPKAEIEQRLTEAKRGPRSITDVRDAVLLVREQQRREWEDRKLDFGTRVIKEQRGRAGEARSGREDEGKSALRAGSKLLDGVAKGIGSFLDAIGNAFAPSPDAKQEAKPQAQQKEPPPMATPEQTSHAEAVRREEQARAERMQQLLQKYGHVVTPEMDRDAELRPGREWGRER